MIFSEKYSQLNQAFGAYVATRDIEDISEEEAVVDYASRASLEELNSALVQIDDLLCIPEHWTAALNMANLFIETSPEKREWFEMVKRVLIEEKSKRSH
jgi:hypothetical protein